MCVYMYNCYIVYTIYICVCIYLSYISYKSVLYFLSIVFSISAFAFKLQFKCEFKLIEMKKNVMCRRSRRTSRSR